VQNPVEKRAPYLQMQDVLWDIKENNVWDQGHVIWLCHWCGHISNRQHLQRGMAWYMVHGAW
jgi:hypothetical protein